MSAGLTGKRQESVESALPLARPDPSGGTDSPGGEGVNPSGCGDVPPDAELVLGIASGSQEAFRLLFCRWAPPLRRFLIRATASREAGEDLLQEAFLRVYRAAPSYTPCGSTRAWLYQICANLAYSFWRREHRALTWVDHEGAPRGPGPTPSPDDPEWERARREFSCEVEEAVGRLSANHRVVFLLKADQGLTYEEIAGILGCPAGTVKSRFHHALLRLRVELRAWGDGFTGSADLPAGTASGKRPRNM
jgi:RNA polymerase sigma-70 factor, ECF subfamily